MNQPVRVLIVDDHLIVREGLRLLLETSALVDVVGEAGNGAECLNRVTETRPQVILMDLQMPVMDGLTAIQQLQHDHPQVAIVILTVFNEDEMMLKGLQAGARGYLLKDTSRDILLDTIQAAARGEALLSPDILSRVLLARTSNESVVSSTHPPQELETVSLTEREREVLQAVAQGERNKEIGYKLGISERTVRAHLENIYAKLGVDSRSGAVVAAAKQGLLDL